MRYLPHTEAEIEEMLQVVGVPSLDQLFAAVPAEHRLQAPLDLPTPMSEWALTAHVEALGAAMAPARGCVSFVGAGSYEHFIPALLPSLLSRAEFLTAYTPYQPEVSQGTLQAVFEYQTLVARLLGMDVANASVWDGASAMAEAALMAIRTESRARERIALSGAVHPAYREVLGTYLRAARSEVVELPYGRDGRTALPSQRDLQACAAVIVQSPNYFGCVEDLAGFAGGCAGAETTLIATFTEALAFGLLRNPGQCGADIACGEGQSLGIPQSFGGPGLGILAARERFTRAMPGRLVGKTVDREGRPGFVITLATREQHIRREKATSNICSNQSLCAVAAGIYLSSVGKRGCRQLAQLNYDKSEYLKAGLRRNGLEIPFAAPTFNEFVVRLPGGSYERLLEQGVVAGLPLECHYPELAGCYLVCATETRSRRDIDRFVEGVAG